MTEPIDRDALLERLRALYWSCMHELNERDVIDAGQLGVVAHVITLMRELEMLPTPGRDALDEAKPGDKAAR